MSDTGIEERLANPKADEWTKRIAARRRSGMSGPRYDGFP